MSGHTHDYLPENQRQSERATRLVIGLTAITMAVEIVAGSMFHSMALLADGWHMGSHASALGITAYAYAHARRNRSDPRYTFGTWKVGVLGGYSSAVVLGVIAVLIGWESVGRLLEPVPIQFDQAIAVAGLGLAVNLLSAFLLRGGHSHGADAHSHHHDHNLRAAFLHVAADALTSVFAILALLAGKLFGWGWMDPIMGIVGAVIISRWSYGLLRETSRVLLDRDVEGEDLEAVRQAVEREPGEELVDLHIWRIGPGARAAILSVVSRDPHPPEVYRQRARLARELVHVTVEVNSSGAAR